MFPCPSASPVSLSSLVRREDSVSLVAKRILVVRYRFIGDTILTVPFLRHLRAAFPDAVIDVLVGPESGQVLANCPYVNELITFDTTRFHKYDSGKGKARSFWSYVSELRSKKYDTVFLLKRSLSSAFLAWLIGAKNRIGYNTEGRGLLLTSRVEWNPKRHEVQSTLDVLRAVGIVADDDFLEAWPGEEEIQSVLQKVPSLVRRKAPRVVFHAAAAHPDKMYPLEHWAKVVTEVVARTGAIPFFTGSAQDIPIYEEITRQTGIEGEVVAGKLELRETMALFSKMDLAICTDSGPAHLAAAAGIPVITLFGPTDPGRWAPPGKNSIALFDDKLSCRPCNYKKTCANRECLTELSPGAVVQTCLNILQSKLTV